MFEALELPLMCAPMSFASSPALARACSQAGVVAGWQGGSATSDREFAEYLSALAKPGRAPPIVNLPARMALADEGAKRLALLAQARAPLVLSSIGDPARMVERVHGWGGRVIQDVTTLRHAEKAIAAGVDGLMLTCAGAGGHTGLLTPFAFVPAVRRIWDGLLIVAGGIAEARGIRGALGLGADLACMGTRFIATPESAVRQEHRDMIAAAGMERIVPSAALNGVVANWIADSLAEAGLDPANLPEGRAVLPDGMRAWRDVFSAGQSVGLIEGELPAGNLVAQLSADFTALGGAPGWRERLAVVEAGWS
ncbi:nitronate monooxygenase [Novosphingobium kunmingense]|uniref:Nitronate monooxygenase n=1 Tax=Novosphingobium kunmingense TaxID=1211806 RepID=A0A2N0H631_9SPHN|nr:nitronate monooxygenase [Novosphingobium kunmingense]PKB14387.1 nitronate monooxygenase [Novosphingobium kunmingense]